FFSSRRRHTRCLSDWSSDVCSSDLRGAPASRSRSPRGSEAPMPGLGKYGTVYSRLAKKRPLLEKLYPTNPQYDGDYTHDKLLTRSEERRVGKEWRSGL